MNAGKTANWLTPLLGSLAAHAGILAVLALVVEPHPAQDQSIPKTQMSIQTQDVKRADAKQATANAETLTERKPDGIALGQVIVPQSRAEPTPVEAESISPIMPPTDVIQRTVGEADRLSSTSPETTAGAATVPNAAAIPEITATASPLQQIETPHQTGFKLDLAAAPIELATLSDRATTASSLALPAEAGKAALAWSGGDGVAVEPSSLAAIQAFMQPSDLSDPGSGARRVRDGITAVLAAVPCARLQTTFIPETGQLELRGHIPEDGLRGPVLSALQQQVGNAIPVTDQLLILPRPQCDALVGISDVGLAQSTEQLTNPRMIGETGYAKRYSYFAGQRLSLELVAPDYDGYVYIDYFTADGMVIHLQPNQVVPLEFASAKSLLTVGNARGDKPWLEITIGAPYGQEIAAAFASSVPLYEGVRSLQETAAPYLNFLKSQVALARETHSDFKGEWVYFFISTAEN